MLRKILGAIAGGVAGIVVIMAVQALGHMLFPPPADINLADPDVLAVSMNRIPLGSKLFVVLAWFLGPLAGGIIGGRIAKARWASWAPGGLTALGLVANAFAIPHPAWMLIGGAIAIAAATFLADRFGAPRGPVD